MSHKIHIPAHRKRHLKSFRTHPACSINQGPAPASLSILPLRKRIAARTAMKSLKKPICSTNTTTEDTTSDSNAPFRAVSKNHSA
ncbi:hypothetical protein VTN77DRAFT_3086 [Rasamsonia byssochlamydoides]|uniref:uncharacterized protein n=1 Tax=Rasamsonia byssochlamydoides TaxID=89139 RepID=UPI003742E326